MRILLRSLSRFLHQVVPNCAAFARISRLPTAIPPLFAPFRDRAVSLSRFVLPLLRFRAQNCKTEGNNCEIVNLAPQTSKRRYTLLRPNSGFLHQVRKCQNNFGNATVQFRNSRKLRLAMGPSNCFLSCPCGAATLLWPQISGNLARIPKLKLQNSEIGAAVPKSENVFLTWMQKSVIAKSDAKQCAGDSLLQP